MKNKVLLYQISIVFLLALSAWLLFSSKYVSPSSTSQDAVAEDCKTTLDVIHERKSVRNFTGETVSKDDILTILKAGMAAPTAVNMQPWHFVVLTERSRLDALSEGLPYAKMLQQAGAAIVVCGNLDKALEGESAAYWVQDCSAATQNILLAVEALGLGAVWTGVYPVQERVDYVSSFLNLSENLIPLNVIPVGVPTGEDKPKVKFDEGNITWDDQN